MSHPITSLIHSRSPPEDQLCPTDIYSSVPQTNNYNTFSGIRAPVRFGTAYTPRGRYQLILKKLLYRKPTEVTQLYFDSITPKTPTKMKTATLAEQSLVQTCSAYDYHFTVTESKTHAMLYVPAEKSTSRIHNMSVEHLDFNHPMKCFSAEGY